MALTFVGAMVCLPYIRTVSLGENGQVAMVNITNIMIWCITAGLAPFFFTLAALHQCLLTRMRESLRARPWTAQATGVHTVICSCHIRSPL